MSNIRKYKISSGSIAADGSATAYSSTIRGRILAVGVDYPTHTCTVDLDTNGEASDQKILDLSAANTDATYYPRTPVHTYNGSAVDLSDDQGGNTAQYEPFVVYGRIKLTIASGTEDESVSVYIVVEED
jgi:hypothetical protein